MKTQSSSILLSAKDYQTMTVGMARVTVNQEIRPGAGFKTVDFVKEKGVGWATVERLVGGAYRNTEQHRER